MCILFVAWRQSRAYPLVVAANRDEFHHRATAPLQWWQEAPRLAAGRDLEAGGTWLGVTRGGRFAALTNVRHPAAGGAPRSRGHLVRDVLLEPTEVPGSLAEPARQRHAYGPFNLLALGAGGLYYLNNIDGEAPQALEPGVYGLSNAGLDTPWPKLTRGREAFASLVARDAAPKACFEMLYDSTPAADEELPNTGVGLDFERRLSALFVRGEGYGTRCSTVVRMAADGHAEIHERRFDAGARQTGETTLEFDISASTKGKA